MAHLRLEGLERGSVSAARPPPVTPLAGVLGRLITAIGGLGDVEGHLTVTVPGFSDGESMKGGRRQSIPPQQWSAVFALYAAGNGYRRIADLLMPLGVSTTKSSVERLIKGRGCYLGRRVMRLVK